jgi:hypothetical protein
LLVPCRRAALRPTCSSGSTLAEVQDTVSGPPVHAVLTSDAAVADDVNEQQLNVLTACML